MECPPGISHPSFSVNHSILEAVRPRLKDFHQLLLDPPKVSWEELFNFPNGYKYSTRQQPVEMTVLEK